MPQMSSIESPVVECNLIKLQSEWWYNVRNPYIIPAIITLYGKYLKTVEGSLFSSQSSCWSVQLTAITPSCHYTLRLLRQTYWWKGRFVTNNETQLLLIFFFFILSGPTMRLCQHTYTNTYTYTCTCIRCTNSNCILLTTLLLLHTLHNQTRA